MLATLIDGKRTLRRRLKHRSQITNGGRKSDMNATFSMLDLDLGESLTLLRETVQLFAADEIKPRGKY